MDLVIVLRAGGGPGDAPNWGTKRGVRVTMDKLGGQGQPLRELGVTGEMRVTGWGVSRGQCRGQGGQGVHGGSKG